MSIVNILVTRDETHEYGTKQQLHIPEAIITGVHRRMIRLRATSASIDILIMHAQQPYAEVKPRGCGSDILISQWGFSLARKCRESIFIRSLSKNAFTFCLYTNTQYQTVQEITHATDMATFPVTNIDEEW